MGLFITSYLTTDLVPPSIADLIMGIVQTEVFDEESGSVDIGPVKKISKLISSHDLKITVAYLSKGRPDWTRSSMSFTTRDIQSRHSVNQILKLWLGRDTAICGCKQGQ
jgi:hypothetical protein